MTTTTHGALLTIPQTAERMGISRAHVYNLVNSGELEYTNVALRKNGPTKKRISEGAIEAFNTSRTRRSPRLRIPRGSGLA